MAKYIVHGGRKLEGEVNLNGAKNAVLPLIAATLLYVSQVLLHWQR